MNRIYAIVGLLGLSFVINNSSNAEDAHKATSFIPALDFAIAEKDMADMEHKAASGDGIAAKMLSRHYGVYKRDHNKEMYWLQIAAENGETSSRLDLGNILLSSFPEYDQGTRELNETRGCFWLRKVISDAPATQIFEEYLNRCNIKVIQKSSAIMK